MAALAALFALGPRRVPELPPRPRAVPAEAPNPDRPRVAIAAPVKTAGTGDSSEEAPIIDAVAVEKDEVCEGEENLVTLRAHDARGHDPLLHYFVGLARGASVPVRLNASSPWPKVRVHSPNGVTMRDVPHYRVKACKALQIVEVSAYPRTNAPDAFDVAARVVELGDRAGAKPFQAKSYRFSFGDGSTATSSTPVVTHGYAERPQEAIESNFVIKVEVQGEGGETLVGRAALSLQNTAFEALEQRGLVTLMFEITPRFPEVGSDGVVRQHVRIWHHRQAPIAIEHIGAQRHTRGGDDSGPPIEIGVTGMLGASEIPPGRGLEVDVTLDVDADKRVFAVDYDLAGRDADGLPAVGTFSVMRPLEKPTKERHRPVTDALLEAKIRRARDLLHQDMVSDEDLVRLQREGRFADLSVPQPEDRAPARPAPMETAAKPKEARVP
jgi:hypothetical protein